ncbi:MAG: hypothetical protein H2184_15655 [Candidatus Galacturonibacter soehngenii]|nr:hypothetical protein [Candidatus Galacturonibacter soehngenii]
MKNTNEKIIHTMALPKTKLIPVIILGTLDIVFIFVANYVRDTKIRQLEQMDSEDILLSNLKEIQLNSKTLRDGQREIILDVCRYMDRGENREN